MLFIYPEPSFGEIHTQISTPPLTNKKITSWIGRGDSHFIVPVPEEAEIGKIVASGWPRKKLETLSKKKTKIKKGG